MPRQSALAGHIAPILESFLLSKDELRSIVQHVSAILSTVDIGVLLVLGWLLVPYMRIVHAFMAPAKNRIKERVSGSVFKNRGGGGENEQGDDKYVFERSYTYIAVDLLSQIARLALLVYACDCLVVALDAVGYKSADTSQIFAKILYTSWFARRFQSFKRYLIQRMINRKPDTCDKFKSVDRVLDGIIFALLFVKILDYLSIATGMALGSVFAVGTTGGLIVSLSSQEIAKGVMNGLEMTASDRFNVGDNVHFGDGTQGYIIKMGFLRTKVRKYDFSVVDIPNSQLGGQRITNISRTKTCRVLTTLRFEYGDISKIPDALEAAKEEIIKACPKLIREGKPFRAMISSFERDCVEATINCNFELPPTGEDFWANREQMFLAIDRGVKSSGIHYAKPINCIK